MLDQISDFFSCCSARLEISQQPDAPLSRPPQSFSDPDLSWPVEDTDEKVSLKGTHIELVYSNLGNDEGPPHPCGAPATFKLYSFDASGMRETRGGERFEARILSLDPQERRKLPRVDITDNNDGSYTATFSVPPFLAGEYLISVIHEGLSLPETPFKVAFSRRSCIDDCLIGKTMPFGDPIDVIREEPLAVALQVSHDDQRTSGEQSVFLDAALQTYRGFPQQTARRMGGVVCMAQLSYLKSVRGAETDVPRFRHRMVFEPMLFSPSVLGLLLDRNPQSLYNLIAAECLAVLSCVLNGFANGGELRIRIKNLSRSDAHVGLPQGAIFEPAGDTFPRQSCVIVPHTCNTIAIAGQSEEEFTLATLALSMASAFPIRQAMNFTPFILDNDGACLRSQSALWAWADTLKPARLAIGWTSGPRTGPVDGGPDLGLDHVFPHLIGVTNSQSAEPSRFGEVQLDLLVAVMRVYPEDTNIQQRATDLITKFISVGTSVHRVSALVHRYPDIECIVKSGSHRCWVLLKVTRDLFLACRIARRYEHILPLREKAAHAVFAILTDMLDVHQAAVVVQRYPEETPVREQACLAVYTILKELKDVFLAADSVNRYRAVPLVVDKAASAVNAILKELKDPHLAASVIRKYYNITPVREKASSAVCSILTALKDVDVAVTVLQDNVDEELIARQASLAVGAILRDKRSVELAQKTIHVYSHVPRVKAEAELALKMLRS